MVEEKATTTQTVVSSDEDAVVWLIGAKAILVPSISSVPMSQKYAIPRSLGDLFHLFRNPLIQALALSPSTHVGLSVQVWRQSKHHAAGKGPIRFFAALQPLRSRQYPGIDSS
jgi:hypothetical protein